MGTRPLRWAWLPLIALLVALAIVLRPDGGWPPAGAQEATDPPTPNMTLSGPATPVTVGYTFTVDVSVDSGSTPFDTYQVEIDLPAGLSFMSGAHKAGGAFPSCFAWPVGPVAGPVWENSACGHMMPDAPFAGLVETVTLRCDHVGTLPLHFVDMNEDPVNGSELLDANGPVTTNLTPDDTVSVQCQGTPTPTPTPTSTPTPTPTPTPTITPTPTPTVTPLDEVIIFDSAARDAEFDEGLARQRLGLLDADGKPQVDGAGNPVPLVSADGKNKGFDMRGGTGTGFEDAFKQLKGDGGTLTVITHGNVGSIELGGESRAGFDDGTGLQGQVGCANPYQLDSAGAKKNLTVNLAVCKAKAKGEKQTRSVADSLTREVTQNGGSVATVTASDQSVTVKATRSARPATGVTLTGDEISKINEAITSTNLNGVPLKDQYKKLQDAIDAKLRELGEEHVGKAVATIKYRADIGGVIIESLLDASEITEITESQDTCIDECPVGGPVGGIAEFPNIASAPAEAAGAPAEGSGWSAGNYAALAGGLAAAVLAAAAGTWYARRRWVK